MGAFHCGISAIAFRDSMKAHIVVIRGAQFGTRAREVDLDVHFYKWKYQFKIHANTEDMKSTQLM